MPHVYHTTIDKAGRVIIPAEIRQALHLSAGTRIVLQIVEGEIRIHTMNTTIDHIQGRVRQVVPSGVNLMDELLAQRREAAAKEDGADSRA